MAAGANSWSLALFLALVCCFWGVLCVRAKEGGGHHVSAGAPAPSTSAADCSSALVSLADCLTFVEGGSTEVKPQGQCCPGLKKVVKKEASCLCQAFGTDFGIKINMTKALALPHACGVKTPPFTKCHIAIGAPGVAPVLPPAAAPSASPSVGQCCESSGTIPYAVSGGLYRDAVSVYSYSCSSLRFKPSLKEVVG